MYLAGNGQRVTQLRLSCAKLAEHLSNGSRLDSSFTTQTDKVSVR